MGQLSRQLCIHNGQVNAYQFAPSTPRQLFHLQHSQQRFARLPSPHPHYLADKRKIYGTVTASKLLLNSSFFYVSIHICICEAHPVPTRAKGAGGHSIAPLQPVFFNIMPMAVHGRKQNSLMVLTGFTCSSALLSAASTSDAAAFYVSSQIIRLEIIQFTLKQYTTPLLISYCHSTTDYSLARGGCFRSRVLSAPMRLTATQD